MIHQRKLMSATSNLLNKMVTFTSLIRLNEMVTFTFLVSLLLVHKVSTHSWMSCPPSFNTNTGRGGIQENICEQISTNTVATHVKAGDRLKVGWTSNNHGGGYVRLSLVPYGKHNSAEAFKNNVLKFACYGHDTRPRKTLYGDCIHPCNARAGCEYQADIYDRERYDANIGIPTNLEDGLYVLQSALLVGNGQRPYYSCGRLQVTGGNTNFKCHSTEKPLKYSCLKAAGPKLEEHFLYTDAKRGDFCYHLNGTIGGIDDNIRDIPINVECDARITCELSVQRDICLRENPSMYDIRDSNTSPKQPSCRVYNILPPPQATCNDGTKNRDEDGLDCGGAFCDACPPAPTKSPFDGAYYRSIKQTLSVYIGGGSFTIKVEIIKDILPSECWELLMQYERPIQLTKGLNSVWSDGRLVFQNAPRTIFQIQKNTWNVNPKAGGTITVAFTGSNVNATTLPWTTDNMHPLTARLEVYNSISNECKKETFNVT